MSRRSRLFVTTAVKDWGQSPLSRVPNTFTPAELSPSLWLDASEASTITASSGAVSQWNNRGSLGNFTQGTGALQPTTGVTTLNGRNVIDFAGDYVTAANTNEWKFLHDGTNYIMAAVLKPGNTADPNALYAILGTNAGAAGASIGIDILYDDRASVPRNEVVLHRVTSAADTVMINISGNAFLPANTFSVLTAFADPDNGTAANRNELYRNAGTAVKNNTATAAVSSGNPSQALQIGAGGNAFSPFTGSIAELIVVSGTNATESNRVLLRDYLRDKWAVY